MAIELVQKNDLIEFKQTLIDEIKKMLAYKPENYTGEVLKSDEVKKMLGISHGTLQRYRNEGIITFTKIGGTILYKREDIMGLLNKGKKGGQNV